MKDSEQLVINIIENCSLNVPTPVMEKRRLLGQLLEIIKTGQNDNVKKNFR